MPLDTNPFGASSGMPPRYAAGAPIVRGAPPFTSASQATAVAPPVVDRATAAGESAPAVSGGSFAVATQQSHESNAPPSDSAPLTPLRGIGPTADSGSVSGGGGAGGIFAALLPLALAGIAAATFVRLREPFFRARLRALAVAASPD
jgi:hypothetical protein